MIYWQELVFAQGSPALRANKAAPPVVLPGPLRPSPNHPTHDNNFVPNQPVQTDGVKEAVTWQCVLGRASPYFLVGAVHRFVLESCNVVVTYLAHLLIVWMVEMSVASDASRVRDGFLYAAAIGALLFIGVVCYEHALFQTSLGCLQVYRELLLVMEQRIGALNSASATGLLGDVQQIIQNDVNAALESFTLQSLWASPCVCVASLVLLNYFIGWPGLLVLPVMVALTAVQGVLSATSSQREVAVSATASHRVHRTMEMLQSIRVIKFMSWETSVFKTIQALRRKELAAIDSAGMVKSMIMSVASSTTALGSLVVFAALFFSEGASSFKPEAIFPSMLLISIIRTSFMQFPISLMQAAQLLRAIQRVHCFCTETQSIVCRPYIEYNDRLMSLSNGLGGVSVRLEGIQLPHTTGPPPPSWSVAIPVGSLTLVIGPTGCGKSTLLSMLAGEACPVSGTVMMDSSASVVPQEAWAMSGTVKSNILMGAQFDAIKYERAVAASQLRYDLDELPEGDETVLGERGVNLSGGQKQRLSIARAVYRSNSIVVMDDCLSAVDAKVARSIIGECIIAPEAFGRKTRILSSSSPGNLFPFATQVIAMEKSTVVFHGTPQEFGHWVTRHNDDGQLSGYFSSFLTSELTHLTTTTALPAPSPTAVTAVTSMNVSDLNSLQPRQCSVVLPSPMSLSRPVPATSKYCWEKDNNHDVTSSTVGWYVRRFGIATAIIAILLQVVCRLLLIIAEFSLSWWCTHDKIFGLGNVPARDSPLYLEYFAASSLAAFAVMMVFMLPLHRGMLNFGRECHDEMLTRFLGAPLRFFDTNSTGFLASGFVQSLRVLDVDIRVRIYVAVSVSLGVAGMIAVAGYAAPYVLIAIGVLAFPYAYVVATAIPAFREANRVNIAFLSRCASTMVELIGGLTTLRNTGFLSSFREHRTQDAIQARVTSILTLYLVKRWISLRAQVIAWVCCMSLMFLLTGFVVQRRDDSTLTPVDRAAALPKTFLSLTMGIILLQFFGLVTLSVAEVAFDFSNSRILERFSTEVPQEEPEVGIASSSSLWSNKDLPSPSGREVAVQSGDEDLTVKGPSITFRNVSIRYDDHLPLVLHNLTLNIDGGTHVGVVGRTGSGKSTLTVALFRLLDPERGGAIYINNEDVARQPKYSTRQRIAVIPQDPLLFSGTVRANLDPYHLATEESLLRVMDVVGLMKLRGNNLPHPRSGRDGGGRESVRVIGSVLDVEVGERGSKLSQGERQLLCLARVLLKRGVDILILDEATASVDDDCSHRIHSIVRAQFKARTVVIVAHRVQTIIDYCDAVVVMDHGVLMESGRPSELLEDQGSLFTAMVSASKY